MADSVHIISKLTGNGGLHVATQCGVFKGTTKAVFVDRREYTGPLQKQIDEAFQFVLRNIHLDATIVGIYRQDIYEIPPDAIRELIINAMVHRLCKALHKRWLVTFTHSSQNYQHSPLDSANNKCYITYRTKEEEKEKFQFL